MIPITRADDSRRPPILDPHRILRWVYLGRLAMSAAIFIAAVVAWKNADAGLTLVASLLIIGALAFTAGSALYSIVYRSPLRPGFLYIQSLFDLVVVTAIVHVTGGGTSQFAALYIVVIAAASLLLPFSGGLLVAALGCVLYFADVLLAPGTQIDLGVWLQLGVFSAVALGSGYIAARLRQAGPAASQLLGLQLDEHVGSPVIETIANTAPELARALERAAQDGTRTTRAEGTVTVHDRRFPIGLNTTNSAGDNGAAEATATAIFQDISDQKRLDSLHARAERLEAVAELSASLAHEIKNPLASIRSAIEQLARSPRTTVDERTLAELVVRESDRLSRLLSEFLDFARVRVARVEPVDLSAVARGAASLASAHPDRPSNVEVVCGMAEGMIVDGDEDLLHRAVFNLALNAVQASPDGGRVRVELAPLSMDEVPAGVSFDLGGVALRVSDDGPGIPLEIRDRLFDPFFTTKPGGSGLGLSIVHRAIEAHSGFVFVDSDDRGTRVTVLLPSHQSDNGELV